MTRRVAAPADSPACRPTLFRVPIYVAAKSGGTFRARSLFFSGPSRSDGSLNRPVSKPARAITRTIEEAGKEPRHDQLARWTFAPPPTQRRLALEIDLRRRTAKVKCCSPPSGTWASGWRSPP